ncbi:MAG: hypothetical protein QOG50_2372 [Actinomycetota bacterium]|nr:hypothetical protein [Actinomycetota bacterium]
MKWTFVLAVAALGTGWLAVLVARVRREIPPTRAAFDRLGRELRPALVELRTQSARTSQDTARLQRGI